MRGGGRLEACLQGGVEGFLKGSERLGIVFRRVIYRDPGIKTIMCPGRYWGSGNVSPKSHRDDQIKDAHAGIFCL